MILHEKYNDYVELLNLLFGKTHYQIVNHSITVAQMVEQKGLELNLHPIILDRAVKLALIHDFGKLYWIENRNENLSDYDSAIAYLNANSNTYYLPNDFSYILYLIKYLDYGLLNSASIMSFPFEVLLVAFADLHVIETNFVSLEDRKNYLKDRYFASDSNEMFNTFWLMRYSFVQKFNDHLSNNSKPTVANDIISLAFYTGGWLYSGEYELMLLSAKLAAKTGKSFIEVGSWRGKSALLIASTINNSKQLLYCIDDWAGGTDTDCLRLANKLDIKAEFQKNTQIFSHNIKMVIGLSTDENVENAVPNEIGFIFLDGAHDYDTIKKELAIYLPKLSKKCIICFHDADNPRYPDVRKIIDTNKCLIISYLLVKHLLFIIL
ncbi:MAG: class I SAM-dependent methyltransferase [Saprospiraceae bacterium]|nr:class I SAM-dependent methyltransferase [Saprospiraceae bacterium]